MGHLPIEPTALGVRTFDAQVTAGQKRDRCLCSISCPKSRSICWGLKCSFPGGVCVSQRLMRCLLAHHDTCGNDLLVLLREVGRELCLSFPLISFFPLLFILLTSARFIFQVTKSCYVIFCLKAPTGSLPIGYMMNSKPQKASSLTRLLGTSAPGRAHSSACHMSPSPGNFAY